MFKFQIVVYNRAMRELFRSEVLQSASGDVLLGTIYDVLTANNIVFAVGDTVAIEQVE